MARYKRLNMLSEKDLGSVRSFLSELKDEALFTARLQKLEDLKAEVNEQIKTYEDCDNIQSAKTLAARRESEAKKVLAEALAARELAKSEIDEEKAAAKEYAEGMRVEARNKFGLKEREIASRERSLDERERDHGKSLDDLVRREGEVAADMKSAVAIRTSYTEATALLKETMDKIAKAL